MSNTEQAGRKLVLGGELPSLGRQIWCPHPVRSARMVAFYWRSAKSQKFGDLSTYCLFLLWYV
ncbi:hypothetical protein ALI44B_00405 [Leifsonia sp. ALI-44-B]|nr:hypothetical protein ALI44B_00405 [Leifsonia sp. ALI-44-B]